MPTTATGVPWGGTPPPAAVTSASGIKYEWRIVALDYTIADGKVSQIHWTLNATNGNQSAGAYGSIGASSLNTPFSALTEQRVVDYVKTDFGSRASDLEKSLAAQIAEKMTPTTATGVPWGGTPPPAAVTSASGIKYEWRIVALDYTIADGKVSQIHWTLNATNGNQSAGAYGSIGASSLNTPFSALTEQRVVDYVKTDFGSRASDLEKSLAAQIAEKMTPTTATGVPWKAETQPFEVNSEKPQGKSETKDNPGKGNSDKSTILEITPQTQVTAVELDVPLQINNASFNTAIVGTGKGDKLTGTSTADAIAAGAGKNQLTGGAGADAFIFESAGEFGSGNADVITDFKASEGDKITISKDAFGGLSKIDLATASGSQGLKKSAISKKSLVYEGTTGSLYFNENGKQKGFGDGGLFAVLQGAPVLGKSDFVLI